jgi:exonuclease V gamma subunit
MKQEFSKDEVLQQIFKEQEVIAPAAEEMRQYLNEVVSTYNLTGTQVLLLMSRLSAAYIHSLKRHFSNEEAQEAVEDFFYESLAAHLGWSKYNDAQRNVELN